MNKLSKTREMLINEFVACLKEEKIPWERGWNIYEQFNPLTHTTYNGVNRFLLNLVSELKGYTDPRWMTFNQIKKQGYHLKDAKGTGIPIEFWSPYDIKEKKTISQSEARAILREEENQDIKESRIKYVCQSYYVFNAKFIEGLPPFEKNHIEITHQDVQDFINEYLQNEGIDFHQGGNRAYYNVAEDSITLPDTSSFKSENYYFATFIHEVAHSSGHETRLNRDLSGTNGTIPYAKEELKAEIGSSFLCADLGIEIDKDIVNRCKSYVQSWISLIEDKPNELFKAIHDAEKITEFIKDHGDYSKIINKDVSHHVLHDKKMSIKDRIQKAKDVQPAKEHDRNHKLSEISR